MSLSLLIKSKLFLQQLRGVGKLSLRMCCKKVARLCNGLPVEETIIFKGNPFLCIFGKPYALGRMTLLELSRKYSLLEILIETIFLKFSLIFQLIY